MPRKVTKKSNRKAPPEEMSGLGGRLEEAMAERGMKRVDLARASDMTPDRITRALSKESIDGVQAATVVRWAKALDVRAGWLLAGEEPKRKVMLLAEDDPAVARATELILRELEQRGAEVEVFRQKRLTANKHQK